MTRPNLFHYATSELSQDAFLCWLLEWANPHYKDADAQLHSLSKSFIEAIFEKHQRPMIEINSVEIMRQLDGLDVLAIINNGPAILIEDKTYTNDHSNQLKRYREAMAKRNINDQLPIYYKIGNQGNYKSIEDAEYKLFHRTDMLKVLERGREQDIQDRIFNDYYQHLLTVENSHCSFQTEPLDKWGWASWHGFYAKLQELGIKGDWGYVANPSGGFNGFWWHWKTGTNSRQYYQLEHGKLCFKIKVEEKTVRSLLRKHWNEKMLDNCQKYELPFKKPERYGNGQYMTVAVLEPYRVTTDEGLLDIQGTIELLRRAEELLDFITGEKSTKAQRGLDKGER